MVTDLLIWCALTVVLVIVLGRGLNGALTLSYFLALSINHIPGLLAYIGPMPFAAFESATETGFKLTILGMGSFIAAVITVRLTGRSSEPRIAPISAAEIAQFYTLSNRLLLLGIGAYFVILPVITFIPSATSVTSAFGSLLLIAIWLRLYAALKERSLMRLVPTLAMMPLLPLMTLVTGGFLGFGTIWVVIILAFLFSIAHRRIWFYLGAAPAIFLGLSLFVTYMQQRGDLRSVMWGESGLVARIEQTTSLVTDFEWFDMSNFEHQGAIAGRLNQNYLIGLMVERHDEGSFQFYHGATVPLWAFVPRAIWPDKPAVGGSGTLAEDTTGLHFAEGTSVGIGQVAEFYINFGEYGIVLGFFAWGVVLMRLDAAIKKSFIRSDAQSLVLAGLPGLALLQPLGSLLEIFVAVVAAVIAAKLLIHFKLLGQGPMRRPPISLPGRGSAA